MTDQPHAEPSEAVAEIGRLKYDAAIDRLADATGVLWGAIDRLLAPENHRALLDALAAAGALVEERERVITGPDGRVHVRSDYDWLDTWGVRLVEPEWRQVEP